MYTDDDVKLIVGLALGEMIPTVHGDEYIVVKVFELNLIPRLYLSFNYVLQLKSSEDLGTRLTKVNQMLPSYQYN